MKANKRSLAVFVITMGLLVSSGYAAWLASVSGYVTFTIDSNKPLMIDIPLNEMTLVPMISSGDAGTLTVNIVNQDGLIGCEFFYQIDDTELVPDDCAVEPGDVETEFLFGGEVVANGQLIYLEVGDNFIDITTSAELYSCPMVRNISMTLNSVQECSPATVETDCPDPVVVTDWHYECLTLDVEASIRTVKLYSCYGYVCVLQSETYETKDVVDCISTYSVPCDATNTGRCEGL